MTTNAAQVHDVPDAVRALAEPHDYVDLFVAAARGASETTPEQWARATMEGAPAAGRFLAWQVICGLHLQPGPDRIAGWRITGRGVDWIRVAADGRFMSAQIVFRVEATRVAFATFVHYDRQIAAPIWGAASVIHRTAAPNFLRGGVRRVARAQADSPEA